jgi:hypothetical protein
MEGLRWNADTLKCLREEEWEDRVADLEGSRYLDWPLQKKEKCWRNMFVCWEDSCRSLLIDVQSDDLTQLAKEGKLDPVIGRDEGMDLADGWRAEQLMFLQKFGGRFKVSAYTWHYTSYWPPLVLSRYLHHSMILRNSVWCWQGARRVIQSYVFSIHSCVHTTHKRFSL